MQATFQIPQHRQIFATQVIKELETEALERSKGKILKMIDDADENVSQKIIEYRRTQKWIYEKDKDDQERFLSVLERIKSEAVKEMVNRKAANASQLCQLGLIEEDILFEIELKRLLADWVELESDISLPVRQGLRDKAIDGERIDYTMLKDLQGKLKSLKDREKCLMQNRFNPLQKDENSYFDISEELREIYNERIQVRKKITKEKQRVGKEKSKVPNLCYFILYDEYCRQDFTPPVEIIYDSVTFNVRGYEYQDRVIYRIQHLSKYYLTIMVGVICNIYNDYYKDEIEINSKTMKKMKRQTNKTSIPEKKELILFGKSEGLTNKEISRQLGKGFGLRTVERYCSL